MAIKVVLADDHTVVLEGLKALLDAQPELQVVETCTDGAEVLAAVEEHHPDVLVLDQDMPELSGIDVTRRLRGGGSDVPILILSASIEDEVLIEAVTLDNVGLVLKESAGVELVEAIKVTYQGERSIPRGLLERALKLSVAGPGPTDPWAALTAREREVVDAVALGLSNKRIAKALGLSEGTVKQYVYGIFQKLGVSNRVELTLMVKERGGG